MRSRAFAVAAMLIAVSMVLAACQPAAAPTPETIVQTVMVEGKPVEVVVTATPAPQEPAPAQEVVKTLDLNMGPGDIPTLDPSLATDTSSITIIENITVGLTVQNEETSALQPGIAQTWDISEDGKVYTFHLRDDVPWVKYDAVNDEVVQVMDCEGNPRVVTANDFAYGALRTLAPATASDYAYVLAFALEGADAFNAGDTDDPTTVGVKVIDDQTLEMTFKQAAAYNAAIAGMWTSRAEPSWLIDGDDCTEARGDRWTETGFNQSYGPYALKEWVHDSYVSIVKNPFWPGQENIPVAAIEQVNWSMLDDQPAFADYEAGNLDAAAVPSADIDRVKSDPILSEELHIAPSTCTYYYGFNTQAPFVDDVRVRLALSEAVDRQALIDNVLKGGQEPAQWFVRPGLAGAPTLADHPDLGVKFDPEDAKAQLQSYLDEKGIGIGDLDLTLMFNTSSGHQRIAEAIQAMWKDNLGVDVQLTNQEWKVFLETVKGANTPQIWRMGWCMDYADANNFDFEVVAVGGSSNPADVTPGVPSGGFFWKNDDYERLVREAAAELDPVKRVDLYAQAEEILVKTDAAMIPIYWYTTVSVTKPYVTRTYSVGGHQIVYHWDIDMNQKLGQ